MKYIFYFVLFASVLKSQTSASRKEITPFIINSVILKDTTTLSTMIGRTGENVTLYEYNDNFRGAEHYLTPIQFSLFKDALWSFIKSPKHKAYKSICGNPISSKELYTAFVHCDSISESYYDASGSEVNAMHWWCDSAYVLSNIQRIDFYESWYFNMSTQMIERETLGYGIYEYYSEKNYYIERLFMFKDEQAYKKTCSFLNY